MKNVLYHLRQQNKLTQNDVAKKLNISQQAYQRYENSDIKNISIDTLLKMAEIFDVNISYILGLENEIKQRQSNRNILNNIRRPIISEDLLNEERENVISLANKLSYYSCLEARSYLTRLIARDEQEARYWNELEEKIKNLNFEEDND